MERKRKAQQFRGSRHSAFGGTFVVKDQKTISGQERVYHRPLAGQAPSHAPPAQLYTVESLLKDTPNIGQHSGGPNNHFLL